jgi:hypothetical protein
VYNLQGREEEKIKKGTHKLRNIELYKPVVPKV